MGRIEPTVALAPQAYRKDQRAKHARVTVNKTIPALLVSSARARNGVERAELIVNPPAAVYGALSQAYGQAPKHAPGDTSKQKRSGGKGNRKSKHTGDDEIGTGVPGSASARLFQTAQSNPMQPLNIRVQVADSLVAAQQLIKGSKHPSQSGRARNVAILNMASPLRPGGGVLNGATSQEESLCVRTTLLSSLKEEWYRLPEVGGVWSPDVMVFRLPAGGLMEAEKGRETDLELERAERFWVDVISAGMIRFPDVDWKEAKVDARDPDSYDGTGSEDEEEVETYREGFYQNEKDRELVLHKIRAVMRICHSKGTESIVLGAWGCGAFGNPVMEVAKAWKKVLLGADTGRRETSSVIRESWDGINEVVFAIKDRNLAMEFARHFGEAMVVEIELDKSTESDINTEHGVRQDIQELEEKISQLEEQIAHARIPILKDCLESVLLKLKSQLPADIIRPESMNCGVIAGASRSGPNRPSHVHSDDHLDEQELSDEDLYTVSGAEDS